MVKMGKYGEALKNLVILKNSAIGAGARGALGIKPPEVDANHIFRAEIFDFQGNNFAF